MTTPILGARVDSDTCIRCRKKFTPGDRIQMVHIVQKLGRNTANVAGAYIAEDFEMAHATCSDPSLSGILFGV